MKAKFTQTIFKILLLKGRSVLSPTQWVTLGRKGLNGNRNIITSGQYYEQYTRLFFQQWQKNWLLSLFRQVQLLFSRLKQKYLFKINKKTRNKDTPIGLDLFKVSNRNTTINFEICSKLMIKTPDQRHWHCSGIFNVSFEEILHLVLFLLTLE